MTYYIGDPDSSITLPIGTLVKDHVKIKLNEENLATLLRSNISCHLNKTMTQELMNELVAQIIESIDYFINKNEETV